MGEREENQSHERVGEPCGAVDELWGGSSACRVLDWALLGEASGPSVSWAKPGCCWEWALHAPFNCGNVRTEGHREDFG